MDIVNDYRARRLRAQGLSFREIAERTGGLVDSGSGVAARVGQRSDASGDPR